eukprot:g657.t1
MKSSLDQQFFRGGGHNSDNRISKRRKIEFVFRVYAGGSRSMDFEIAEEIFMYKPALLSWVPYFDRNYFDFVCKSLTVRRKGKFRTRYNPDRKTINIYDFLDIYNGRIENIQADIEHDFQVALSHLGTTPRIYLASTHPIRRFYRHYASHQNQGRNRCLDRLRRAYIHTFGVLWDFLYIAVVAVLAIFSINSLCNDKVCVQSVAYLLLAAIGSFGTPAMTSINPRARIRLVEWTLTVSTVFAVLLSFTKFFIHPHLNLDSDYEKSTFEHRLLRSFRMNSESNTDAELRDDVVIALVSLLHVVVFKLFPRPRETTRLVSMRARANIIILMFPLLLISIATMVPSMPCFPIFAGAIMICRGWAFRKFERLVKIKRLLLALSAYSLLLLFLFNLFQMPLFKNTKFAGQVGFVRLAEQTSNQRAGLLAYGAITIIFAKFAMYIAIEGDSIWFAGARLTDGRLAIVLGFDKFRQKRNDNKSRSQRPATLIIAVLLMFLSFESVTFINFLYLCLIFVGFVAPVFMYERLPVLCFCLEYTVFMTFVRYIVGVTFMIDDYWDCSIGVDSVGVNETYGYNWFGISIDQGNREILQSVGLTHDVCEVGRTPYLTLVCCIAALSAFVRVHPTSTEDENKATEGLANSAIRMVEDFRRTMTTGSIPSPTLERAQRGDVSRSKSGDGKSRNVKSKFAAFLPSLSSVIMAKRSRAARFSVGPHRDEIELSEIDARSDAEEKRDVEKGGGASLSVVISGSAAPTESFVGPPGRETKFEIDESHSKIRNLRVASGPSPLIVKTSEKSFKDMFEHDVLGDLVTQYVYETFITVSAVVTGDTTVTMILVVTAISNLSILYVPFLVAFVLTALFPTLLKVSKLMIGLIMYTELILLVLYVADLARTIDENIVDNDDFANLLSLYGINAEDSDTSKWVSSSRGILPAASLFIYAWHQARWRESTSEKMEQQIAETAGHVSFGKFKRAAAVKKREARRNPVDVTAILQDTKDMVKSNNNNKKDSNDDDEDLSFSGVANMILSRIRMRQERIKVKERASKGTVLTYALYAMITRWRTPMKFVLLVTIYSLVIKMSVDSDEYQKYKAWAGVGDATWRILLFLLPAAMTFAPPVDAVQENSDWAKERDDWKRASDSSTEADAAIPSDARDRRRSRPYVVRYWMYAVATYGAANTIFMYVMMIFPFPFERNSDFKMNYLQDQYDTSYKNFGGRFYGIPNATGFYEANDIGYPSSGLEFEDLFSVSGYQIIMFVLSCIYCSIDSKSEILSRNARHDGASKSTPTHVSAWLNAARYFLAYSSEYCCTILISCLGVGEVHGVAGLLLFMSLLWVMTPRTVQRSKIWIYRCSAIFGSLVVLMQAAQRVEYLGELYCDMSTTNQDATNNSNSQSGIYGSYMCLEHVRDSPYSAWECPGAMSNFYEAGPRAFFYNGCDSWPPGYDTLANATMYTSNVNKYCIPLEYKLYCTLYPTGNRSPSLNEIRTTDTRVMIVLVAFLLCSALLAVSEKWREAIERETVEATFEDWLKARKRKEKKSKEATRLRGYDSFASVASKIDNGDDDNITLEEGSKIEPPKFEETITIRIDPHYDDAKSLSSSRPEGPSPCPPCHSPLKDNHDAVDGGNKKNDDDSLSVKEKAKLHVEFMAVRAAQLREMSKFVVFDYWDELRSFLPQVTVALLVIGSWLHCNLISLCFMTITTVLVILPTRLQNLRLILCLQFVVLGLIIAQYGLTFARLHYEDDEDDDQSFLFVSKSDWTWYGGDIDAVDNGILVFDEVVILAMVMWYNNTRIVKHTKKKERQILADSKNVDRKESSSPHRTDEENEEKVKAVLSSWRLLSPNLSPLGMVRFLHLWKNVYSAGGIDDDDFMTSFGASGTGSKLVVDGDDLKKIAKYLFVAVLPECLVCLIFVLGTCTFNVLSLPYVILPVVFVGSHRVLCWFGDEEHQINDFEVKSTKFHHFNSGEPVEVRPKSFPFWLEAKILSASQIERGAAVYEVKLQNGLVEKNVSLKRIRRKLKRRTRGHRWMLTWLWVYNICILFVRYAIQHDAFVDSSCKAPSHYSVIFGLRKRMQGSCSCPEAIDGILLNDTYSFDVNNLETKWEYTVLPANTTDEYDRYDVGNPEITIDVAICLILLMIHALVKSSAWGTRAAYYHKHMRESSIRGLWLINLFEDKHDVDLLGVELQKASLKRNLYETIRKRSQKAPVDAEKIRGRRSPALAERAAANDDGGGDDDGDLILLPKPKSKIEIDDSTEETKRDVTSSDIDKSISFWDDDSGEDNFFGHLFSKQFLAGKMKQLSVACDNSSVEDIVRYRDDDADNTTGDIECFTATKVGGEKTAARYVRDSGDEDTESKRAPTNSQDSVETTALRSRGLATTQGQLRRKLKQPRFFKRVRPSKKRVKSFVTSFCSGLGRFLKYLWKSLKRLVIWLTYHSFWILVVWMAVKHLVDRENTVNFVYFFVAYGFILLLNPHKLPIPNFTMIEMRTQNYGAVCISDSGDTIVSANEGVHLYRPNELTYVLRDVEMSFDGRVASHTASFVALAASEAATHVVSTLKNRVRNRFTLIRKRIFLRKEKMLREKFASALARHRLKGVQWHTEFWNIVESKFMSKDLTGKVSADRFALALKRAKRSMKWRRIWRWAFLRVLKERVSTRLKGGSRRRVQRVVAAAVSGDGRKVISISDHGVMSLHVLVPFNMPGWSQDATTEMWNTCVDPETRLRRERVIDILVNKCKAVGRLVVEHRLKEWIKIPFASKTAPSNSSEDASAGTVSGDTRERATSSLGGDVANSIASIHLATKSRSRYFSNDDIDSFGDMTGKNMRSRQNSGFIETFRETVKDLGSDASEIDRGQAFPSCVAITDDGNVAITAGRDGKVKAWILQPDSRSNALEGRELVPMGVVAGRVHHSYMQPFSTIAISGGLDKYRTLMLGFEVGEGNNTCSGVQLWRVQGLDRGIGAMTRVLNRAQSKEFDTIFKNQDTSISNAIGKSGLTISPSGTIGVTGHFSGWVVIWGFHWHRPSLHRNAHDGRFTISALRKWSHESPVQRVRLLSAETTAGRRLSNQGEDLRLFVIEPLIDMVCEYRVMSERMTHRRRRSLSHTTMQSLMKVEGSALNVSLLRSFTGHSESMNMSLSDPTVDRKSIKSFVHPLALSKPELIRIAIVMAQHLKVQGTRYRFMRRRYMNCFKGSAFVSKIVETSVTADRHSAILIGTRMSKMGILRCITPSKGLRDDGKYYQFFWDVLKYSGAGPKHLTPTRPSKGDATMLRNRHGAIYRDRSNDDGDGEKSAAISVTQKTDIFTFDVVHAVHEAMVLDPPEEYEGEFSRTAATVEGSGSVRSRSNAFDGKRKRRKAKNISTLSSVTDAIGKLEPKKSSGKMEKRKGDAMSRVRSRLNAVSGSGSSTDLSLPSPPPSTPSSPPAILRSPSTFSVGEYRSESYVCITIKSEFIRWLEDRNFAPNVSMALEQSDTYAAYIFQKLEKMDITHIAKKIFAQSEIRCETARILSKAFACREPTARSVTSKRSKACRGLRLVVRSICPEEGLGDTKKWILLANAELHFIGCSTCKEHVANIDRPPLLRAILNWSKKNSRETEEKSCCLARASRRLMSRTWDPLVLTDYLSDAETVKRYLEDYVENNNVSEDLRYVKKLSSSSALGDRFKHGPFGSFDVIERSLRSEVAAQLATPASPKSKRATRETATPSSVAMQWWAEQDAKNRNSVDTHSEDPRKNLRSKLQPWKLDVVRRIAAFVRAQRSLKKALEASATKRTMSKFTEWVHPVVQRPHKVVWRTLIVIVVVVLWLKIFAQIRAVRVCDGGFETDPLILPPPPLQMVTTFTKPNHEEETGLFYKAMDVDNSRNDMNLDGYFGSFAFIEYACADLILLFLILFHLNVVQSEGLWNSLDSKGWKFIRSQFDTGETGPNYHRHRTTAQVCWKICNIFVNIAVHKVYSFYKDTVLHLAESLRTTHLKPGEDFFGLTVLAQILIFFVVLFTQASLSTTLSTNYIEASYVIKIVVVLVVGYLDRIAYVRRTIALKFCLHVTCMVMYVIWWNAELHGGGNSRLTLAILSLAYLLVSALQICYGYPAISQFGVISGADISKNYYNKRTEIYGWTFRIYRFFPFLPEIATVLDWACTDTTLLIGDWMRTADIYAAVFESEIFFDFLVLNKREKGHAQALWRKIVQGGLLSLLLFLVLIFPLIVFSEFNPTNSASSLSATSISIGFSGYAPLYIQSANTSLAFLSDSGDGECAYADAYSAGSTERRWYDQEFCFTEPTFNYACLTNTDDSYYEYLSSVDISSAYTEYTQFIYFPSVASQSNWIISQPDKINLIDELQTSASLAKMDVSLTFERTNYETTEATVDFTTSVSLTDSQKNEFLTLISSYENRSQHAVTVENLVPIMMYLDSDGDSSVPNGIGANEWLDCDFSYATTLDTYRTLLNNSEIEAGQTQCSYSGNGSNCSFSFVTPWSERIGVEGTCIENGNGEVICDTSSERLTAVEHIVNISERVYPFEEWWEVQCYYRNRANGASNEITFGRPTYWDQTTDAVSECFQSSCEGGNCYTETGPFLFVVSAPYVFLLQYLSSSSIVGLYVVFVFAVSRVIRDILRGGRKTIMYQYMPFARRIANIVETMDKARSMAMMSSDKDERCDFLELEDELFSDLINKYRRPDELYKVTGEFKHWFLASQKDDEERARKQKERIERSGDGIQVNFEYYPMPDSIFEGYERTNATTGKQFAKEGANVNMFPKVTINGKDYSDDAQDQSDLDKALCSSGVEAAC